MQEAAARDAAAAASAAAASNYLGGGGGYHHQQQQCQQQQQQQHHHDYGISENHQLHHHHPHMMMDNMDESVGSLSMESEQLSLLRALNAQLGDHRTLQDTINMMGLNPNDALLLQMLAQQEQEITRPDEHYLTIAQNGKLY